MLFRSLVRRQMDLGNEIKELENVAAASADKAVAENVVNAESKFRPEAI